MLKRPLEDVLGRIRQTALPSSAELTDAELLHRYVAERDEASFTLLVERHGRMVLNVCHRILSDPHAVDDAFQASFLILVQNAGTIRKSGSVASWLFGVARRVALRAKSKAARARKDERQTPATASADPGHDAAWRELRPILNQEVNRLPEKYRLPLILCYFEGLSNEEAAQQLSWPSGTVKGRLARARDVLRDRLSLKGVALSIPMLTGLLAQEAMALPLPAGLVNATVKLTAVATAANAIAGGSCAVPAYFLAKETMRSMFYRKMTPGVLTVLVLCMTGSAAWLSFHSMAGKPATGQAGELRKNVPFSTLSKGESWIKPDIGGPGDRPKTRVVKNRNEWVRNGFPKDQVPDVDFSQSMIVVVTSGKKPCNGYTAEITRIEQGREGVRVHYEDCGPAEPEPPRATYPYHLVRVARLPGPVEFVKTMHKWSSRPVLKSAMIQLSPIDHTGSIRKVVRNAEDLAALWQETESGKAIRQACAALGVADIDFEKQMLIAASNGPIDTTRFFVRYSIFLTELKGTLSVDIQRSSTSMGRRNESLRHPALLALVNRFDGPINFETGN